MEERLRYIAVLLGLRLISAGGIPLVELPPGTYVLNERELSFVSSDGRYRIVSRGNGTVALVSGTPFELDMRASFIVTELWGGLTEGIAMTRREARRVVVNDPEDFLTIVRHAAERGCTVDVMLESGSVTKYGEPGFMVGNFETGFVEIVPNSISYYGPTENEPRWKFEFGTGELIGIAALIDRIHFILSRF